MDLEQVYKKVWEAILPKVLGYIYLVEVIDKDLSGSIKISCLDSDDILILLEDGVAYINRRAIIAGSLSATKVANAIAEDSKNLNRLLQEETKKYCLLAIEASKIGSTIYLSKLDKAKFEWTKADMSNLDILFNNNLIIE